MIKTQARTDVQTRVIMADGTDYTFNGDVLRPLLAGTISQNFKIRAMYLIKR